MSDHAEGDHYDALIIGAGQSGGPLAGAFAREGRRTALIERQFVGGTCINTGCTPTKTMIASARVAQLARESSSFGVDSKGVTVSLQRVRERKQDVVERFRNGSEDRLERSGVEIIEGSARFTGAHAVEVSTANGHRRLSADIIFINTGMRPSIPELPGIDAVPFLTSTSIMELDELPQHLLVLGGGYVGLEFAQMFRRFGSEVTIVHRGSQLMSREDNDVARAVAEILTSEGVSLFLETTATAVSGGSGDVKLSTDRGGGGRMIQGSHLLVATGRRPNTDGLDLEAAGVETDDRGFIRVDGRLKTSADGVYALGDVNGGPAFTHVSYDDFRILKANLLKDGNESTENRTFTYTLYLDPQLGRVGLTEREARESGRPIRVAKMPMAHVARAIETGETKGLMKAIVDAERGTILGAAVLGTEGGELAALIQVAMMAQLHYSRLRDAIFAHPTLAESLNNLFVAMDRNDAVKG